MTNYIKSELYRIAKGKTLYFLAGILAALTVAMNVGLFLVKQGDADFPYATMWSSLNVLTSNLSFLFTAGALVVALLFSEERKIGTLKNSIAHGISRESIFIGKCIVSSLSSIVVMLIVLVFYVGSAYLLLDAPGAEPLQKMIGGILAAMPSALASVFLTVAILSLCGNITVSIVLWGAITFIVPEVAYQIGLRSPMFSRIAGWLPTNIFADAVTANMSEYERIWDTSFGLMKCLTAGFGFMLIFAAIGLLGFRKKEV